MTQFKISTRLTLLVGVLSLLLGVGGLGLFGISKTNDALQSVYEDRTVPAAQLGDIRARMLRNRMDLNIALVTPTPEIIRERTADVESNIAAISKTWDAYMATYLTPEESVPAKTFTEDRKKFVQEGLIPTLTTLRANDLNEAKRLLTEKVRPLATRPKRAMTRSSSCRSMKRKNCTTRRAHATPPYAWSSLPPS